MREDNGEYLLIAVAGAFVIVAGLLFGLALTFAWIGSLA